MTTAKLSDVRQKGKILAFKGQQSFITTPEKWNQLAATGEYNGWTPIQISNSSAEIYIARQRGTS